MLLFLFLSTKIFIRKGHLIMVCGGLIKRRFVILLEHSKNQVKNQVYMIKIINVVHFMKKYIFLTKPCSKEHNKHEHTEELQG